MACRCDFIFQLFLIHLGSWVGFFLILEKRQFLQGVLATSLIWHCVLVNWFCLVLLGIVYYIMISCIDLLWGL